MPEYKGIDKGVDVIGYYRSNQKRMQYRTFRALGLPVGSGIVERAHRHVLQVRMKRAGQRLVSLAGSRGDETAQRPAPRPAHSPAQPHQLP